MINSTTDTVTVSILGREFKIKCPKDKIAELKKAATYLDSKMQEVHHGNKLITIDRVAITAALNIANELILTKQQVQLDTCDFNNRLSKMHQTLANAK